MELIDPVKIHQLLTKAEIKSYIAYIIQAGFFKYNFIKYQLIEARYNLDPL